MIKTPDGKDVFLPNSIILKNPLFNYTIDGFLRYEFIIGITYENNPVDAIQLILETTNKVEGVLKDDKKLRLQDLQKHVGLSQSAMSRLVTRLESKDFGAIERSICKNDKRGIYIHLTNKNYEQDRISKEDC